jgi:hypothetical protein
MAYTTPPTFTAGAILTAAQLNTYLTNNFKAIGDAWAAWTPTLSNWTLGNGTLTGAAITVGKLIIGRVTYTVGSTDTIAGNLVISLPATSGMISGIAIGQAGLFDTSTGNRAFRTVWQATATTMQFSTEADARITPTAPWTWATGDTVVASFVIEVV